MRESAPNKYSKIKRIYVFIKVLEYPAMVIENVNEKPVFGSFLVIHVARKVAVEISFVVVQRGRLCCEFIPGAVIAELVAVFAELAPD